jgi:hypothetical protein
VHAGFATPVPAADGRDTCIEFQPSGAPDALLHIDHQVEEEATS